jgi:enoyl-CoA hydratase/carnithine racemase
MALFSSSSPKAEAPNPIGTISFAVQGPLALMVVDHQTRLNAITPAMARTVCETLPKLAANPDVRVLVVMGAGEKAFVSGADIESLETADNAAATGTMDDFNAMFPAIRSFPKPTVALIKGYCFGAGVALAVACDLRLTRPGASFSIPSARLGVGYPLAFTHWLMDVVGAARTKEFLLTARRYTAEEALSMTLVHKIIDPAEFDKTTREYCTFLAQNAPLAMQSAKTSVNALADARLAGDMAAATALIEACQQSADHAEGRRAFLEKRPPVFEGR